MIERTKSAISKAMGQWRLATIVYVIQLLLAMTMGMQMYQVFESTIGNSLELDRLLSSYDHTVVQDFLHVHGDAIASLIGQARYLILAYLVFCVFTHAGLINAVYHGHTRFKDFWEGGALYFFKFLKLSLLFLIAYIIAALIIGGLIFGVLINILELPSERVGFALIGGIAFIFIIFLIKAFSASTYAKLAIVDAQKRPWQAFLHGWGQLRRKWKPTFGIILPLIFIQLCIYGLYLCVESVSGMTTIAWILIFFVIQQAMILFRSIWKLMLYNGLYEVYIKK